VRAAVRRTYGGPEVLSVEEIEKPTPGDGQVLISTLAPAIPCLDAACGDRFVSSDATT
jgi:NADPH:quinone reductase-like Zn-dependent oxidoreductase